MSGISTTREATRPTLPARHASAPPPPSAARSATTRGSSSSASSCSSSRLVAMVRLADRSTELNPDFLASRALRALGRRPDDAGGARLRARAQRRQAGGRAAARPAVRAVSREAGAGAARADRRAVRARPDRRQRADPQQHGEVVQPADRRRPHRGDAHRAGLLPRSRGERGEPRGAASRATIPVAARRDRAISTACGARSRPRSRRDAWAWSRFIASRQRPARAADGRPAVRRRSRRALPPGGRLRRRPPIAWPRSSRRGRPSRTRRNRSTAAVSSFAPARRFAIASGRLVGVVLASDICRASRRATRGRSSRPTRIAASCRRCGGRCRASTCTLFVMMTLMILVSATWTGSTSRSASRGRCSCSPPARARSAPAISTTASSRRRATSSVARRGVQHDGRRAGRQPAQARTLARSISSARTSSSTSAAGTSRRSSSASRPASSRSDPTGGSRRSTARRCGCSTSIATVDRRARRGRLRARGPQAAAAAPAPDARIGASAPAAQEIALLREGRELHLAAGGDAAGRATTAALGGAVLVFDDVTPLIRTQRVAAWRDVARRLAHEIKNPLTPIQLSAERLRRHFSAAPPTRTRARRRVHDDDRRRGRVAQGRSSTSSRSSRACRRRRPFRPTSMPSLDDTLALYDGLFKEIRIERRFAPDLPPVRVDVEQIRQVVINLVDNAIEALGGSAAPRASGRTAADDRGRDAARSGQRRRADPRRRTTVRASRPPIATSCSCRTTRPRAAAAASASRSSAGSSPSTAAASKSPTTCQPARCSPSICPCEAARRRGSASARLQMRTTVSDRRRRSRRAQRR